MILKRFRKERELVMLNRLSSRFFLELDLARHLYPLRPSQRLLKQGQALILHLPHLDLSFPRLKQAHPHHPIARIVKRRNAFRYRYQVQMGHQPLKTRLRAKGNKETGRLLRFLPYKRMDLSYPKAPTSILKYWKFSAKSNTNQSALHL